jgi:hypothetical protein
MNASTAWPSLHQHTVVHSQPCHQQQQQQQVPQAWASSRRERLMASTASSQLRLTQQWPLQQLPTVM